MNLSRSEIWRAINNRSDDDISEDEDYRNGVMGDVVNIENMLLDIDPSKHVYSKKEEEGKTIEFVDTGNEVNEHAQDTSESLHPYP